MPTVKLWSATYATAHNISDANALKAMGEAGVRQYIWLKQTPTCSASDWGSLLADPAGGSATVVHFVAAGFACQHEPRELRRRAVRRGVRWPRRRRLGRVAGYTHRGATCRY
eukprot:8940015-Pyramimonas_sp.AAC.1